MHDFLRERRLGRVLSRSFDDVWREVLDRHGTLPESELGVTCACEALVSAFHGLKAYLEAGGVFIELNRATAGLALRALTWWEVFACEKTLVGDLPGALGYADQCVSLPQVARLRLGVPPAEWPELHQRLQEAVFVTTYGYEPRPSTFDEWLWSAYVAPPFMDLIERRGRPPVGSTVRCLRHPSEA